MNGSSLARALSDLSVEFFLDNQASLEQDGQIQPSDLIGGLAASSESRLRLALIPLFLQHPEFSEFVSDVLPSLSATASITLRCYYSAAVCLQAKYHSRLVNLFGLQPALPTLFFEELRLDPNGDSQKNLQNLAQYQKFLTCRPINWLGTYEHAALRLLGHKEREPE
jgi:hypothetical protein